MRYRTWQRSQDPTFALQSIIQTGPKKAALKTEYLAELLQISLDKPLSALTFDLHAARRKLLSSPLIESATLRLIKPATLYIDYVAREPVAWFYDYENVALDKKGYPIPFSPFFAPKNLPEVYLGAEAFGKTPSDSRLPSVNWNRPLSGASAELALNLLAIFQDHKIREKLSVSRIDVSNAFADSYGAREIVLLTEDEIIHNKVSYLFPKMLRLSTQHYLQDLGNYLKLRESLVEEERLAVAAGATALRAEPKIIDLRLENLALVGH